MATTKRNASANDPYAKVDLTVSRTRKGRSTVKRDARWSTLDKIMAAGPNRDLKVIGNDGQESTVKVTVIGPATFGEPETFTGVPATVSQWAKAKGHAVRLYKVQGNVYGLARKG